MASPNFMGLASFGPQIGIFGNFMYSVLVFNAISGAVVQSPRGSNNGETAPASSQRPRHIFEAFAPCVGSATAARGRPT
jgi:hypothetical protein